MRVQEFCLLSIMIAPYCLSLILACRWRSNVGCLLKPSLLVPAHYI